MDLFLSQRKIQVTSPRTVLIVRSHPDYLVNFHGPLITQLVARGHRVVCGCPDAEDHHKRALEEMGAEFRAIPFARRGLNPVSGLDEYRRFARLAAEVRPDVALMITVKPIVYGVRALRRTGCLHIFGMMCGMGYVFGAHETLRQRMVGWIGSGLVKSALRQCNGVLFHNPDDAEELRALGILGADSAVHITYGSGIDVTQFSEAPLPAAPRVLTIARLIEAKGIREYAAAARRVRKTHPDVVFALVGWFEEGADAISRAQVEAWVASGDIEFLGRLSDVRPAIADSTIFALPTYYREGLPRTILEAMAMGRPIVTTDAPGCKETVRNSENGRVVPRQDVDALVNALLELIDDPNLVRELGRNSRQLAAESFDCHTNAHGIINFVNKTAGVPLL